MTKILVVGAGLFGAVCAYKLKQKNHIVHVIDKRDHMGGNCFTRFDERVNCHEHVYGPHIFHTNNQRVWDFITQFVVFNRFIYSPKVFHEGKFYSLPINLMTLHQIDKNITTPQQAEYYLRKKYDNEIINERNLEDWCLNNIGDYAYERLIRGYTEKQWGRPCIELPSEIIKRLPIYYGFCEQYFNDKWQGIPIGGYTRIFDDLLGTVDSLKLQTDFLEEKSYYMSSYPLIIYSGSLDSFFDYQFGKLQYRSLQFTTQYHDICDFQGTAVINHTSKYCDYTRTIEHKHFTPERFSKYDTDCTLVTTEYPHEAETPADIPYYPIPTDENVKLAAKYKILAAELYGKVIFGGRLGTYKYLNMDQVIESALNTVEMIRRDFL